jgi:CHAT domain-containing protein
LRPTSLSRRQSKAIQALHPLVFLNVCGAGRQGRSLAGLTGWVRAWVERCGASALLAPICTVRDDLAYLFATTFYDRLVQGDPLATAVRAGRDAARQKAPDDPTWLSYVAYGHPNARLLSG